jgi:hypothetical protein
MNDVTFFYLKDGKLVRQISKDGVQAELGTWNRSHAHYFASPFPFRCMGHTDLWVITSNDSIIVES